MANEDATIGQEGVSQPRRTRRDLLKTAGVVAGAAVAGKLVGADAASANDGQPLVVAANNSAQQPRDRADDRRVSTPPPGSRRSR